MYAETLPGGDQSLAYPFGGLALNIGVSTDGHRDEYDKDVCCIIPFGPYTGGDLGLFEFGFIFDLHPLDLAIFRSCDITHFNRHFKGVRFSLVLHTDKSCDKWVYDANGWR